MAGLLQTRQEVFRGSRALGSELVMQSQIELAQAISSADAAGSDREGVDSRQVTQTPFRTGRTRAVAIGRNSLQPTPQVMGDLSQMLRFAVHRSADSHLCRKLWVTRRECSLIPTYIRVIILLLDCDPTSISPSAAFRGGTKTFPWNAKVALQKPASAPDSGMRPCSRKADSISVSQYRFCVEAMWSRGNSQVEHKLSELAT
jgi:hypothetical protein